MQKKIDLKNVVQLEVTKVKLHDYIINLGEIIKVESTTEFVSFWINGNCISAFFYWYRKGTTLLIIQADSSKPVGLS